MRSIVWKDASCGCRLYGACSRSVVNVCISLEMSIVDLCLVRVMCGFVQWLLRLTLSSWSSDCRLLAWASVV